jgi:predicted alpha/beta hydrolase family esterase
VRSYLILHGWKGSGPDHWQTWLAERLRAEGRDVRYPDLPNADDPDLHAWLEALEAERREGDTVICHSLACHLWLHHRARGGPPAERVLFVAPPCLADPPPEIAGFVPAPLTPAGASNAHLICSDDDPYCPRGAPATFGEPLGLQAEILPGAGHINPESGYGPWPAVLAWCYGAKKGVET